MKRDDNMQAVRDGLITRNLQDKLMNETNWTLLLNILKYDEKSTLFKPLTAYANFKWHTIHLNDTHLIPWV